MPNPYSDLPDHCFWSRAHRVGHPGEVDPVVSGGFRVTPDTRIATAGSCFAQHLANHLQADGYNYFVTEAAHPFLSDAAARALGYGMFSARYGNIYTTRQLRQLLERAHGRFAPVEEMWHRDGAVFDPFRPNIQPEGFVNEAEFRGQRDIHFAAIRRMVAEMDVFVFTLGLTEAWISREDGAVFPLAPGVVAGTFDPARHAFHNFTVDEVVDDFRAAADLIRAINPDVRFLLTVSPVPLIATAREDRSVITSTAYSKAVLRVAAETLERGVEGCHYFPSYEVITGNFNRGAYFADDLRDVRTEGVGHVMDLFMRHYTDTGAGTAPAQRPASARDDAARRFVEETTRELDVICDEELIETGGRRR